MLCIIFLCKCKWKNVCVLTFSEKVNDVLGATAKPSLTEKNDRVLILVLVAVSKMKTF